MKLWSNQKKLVEELYSHEKYVDMLYNFRYEHVKYSADSFISIMRIINIGHRGRSTAFANFLIDSKINTLVVYLDAFTLHKWTRLIDRYKLENIKCVCLVDYIENHEKSYAKIYTRCLFAFDTPFKMSILRYNNICHKKLPLEDLRYIYIFSFSNTNDKPSLEYSIKNINLILQKKTWLSSMRLLYRAKEIIVPRFIIESCTIYNQSKSLMFCKDHKVQELVDFVCSICFDDLEPNDVGYESCCKQLYCENCFLKLLKLNKMHCTICKDNTYKIIEIDDIIKKYGTSNTLIITSSQNLFKTLFSTNQYSNYSHHDDSSPEKIKILVTYALQSVNLDYTRFDRLLLIDLNDVYKVQIMHSVYNNNIELIYCPYRWSLE